MKKNQAGLTLVGWTVAVPFILVGVLILIALFIEGKKAYWDHRVTEMCKMDGGMTVFEKVSVSQEEYKRLGGVNGEIPVPDEMFRGNSPYYSIFVTQVIHSGKPEILKHSAEIIRFSDRKVLGKQLSYTRVGGNITLAIAHPSSFSCSDVEGIKLGVEKQIFIIEDGIK